MNLLRKIFYAAPATVKPAGLRFWHVRRLFCVNAVTFALLGVAAGCAEQPGIERLPSDAVILAFGDSLTTGVGARTDESYPSVLAGLSERRVINAGVSGERTAGGLQRLPGELAKTNPGLLILLLGGNDLLRKVDAGETRANLAAMIELAQSQDVTVLLVGVPELRLLSGVAPFYDELADEYGVLYEPALLGRLLRRPRYKSDPIHLNAAGYRELALGLHKVLQGEGVY